MLEEFKVDLNSLSSLQLIRKYILNGSCHVLNRDQHFRLKEEICDHFKVDFNHVILVGSGKLGFSIKAEKRFQSFGEESDIDVAVVSAELFQKVWEEAYLYKKSGAYWPKSTDFFGIYRKVGFDQTNSRQATISHLLQHGGGFSTKSLRAGAMVLTRFELVYITPCSFCRSIRKFVSNNVSRNLTNGYFRVKSTITCAAHCNWEWKSCPPA